MYPFVTPLGVRENGADRLRLVPVEEIGGWAGSKPLPLGLVALTEFQAEGQWRMRRLPPGRAALALLANTLPARRWPERSLALVQRIVSQVTVIKGTRGEAAAAVPKILTALAATAANVGDGKPRIRSFRAVPPPIVPSLAEPSPVDFGERRPAEVQLAASTR